MSKCEISFRDTLKSIEDKFTKEEMDDITKRIEDARVISRTTSQFKNKVREIVNEIRVSQGIEKYYKEDSLVKSIENYKSLNDPGFNGMAGEAALSHLRNSPYAAQGTANNVESNKNYYMNVFKNVLNFSQDAKTKIKVLSSAKLRSEQAEIIRYIESGGKYEISPHLKDTADTVKKTYDTMLVARKRSGMYASQITDYTKHTHNWKKMKAGGFDKWMSKMLSTLDIENSFDGDISKAQEVLGKMWSKFEANEVGIDTKSFDEIFGEAFSATTARHRRQLHFKENGGYSDYWLEYGDDTLIESMYKAMNTESRNIALFEKFGANPKTAFENLFRDATDKAVADLKKLEMDMKTVKDPKELKKLESKRNFMKNNVDLMKQGYVPEDVKGPVWATLNKASTLFGFDRAATNNPFVNFFRGERAMNTFAAVSGELDHPANVGLASFTRNWAALSYARTLGSMVLGSIPDAANMAAASVKNFGVSYGAALTDDFTQALKAISMDKEMAQTLGFALEDIVSDMARTATAEGPTSKTFATMNRGLGMVSGMNLYQRSMNKLAGHLHSKYFVDALENGNTTAAFLNNIKRNALSDKDIANIKSAIRETGYGKFIDSEELFAIDVDTHKKYQRMVENFLAEGSTNQDSAKMKGIMSGGHQAGTVQALAYKSLWMFKSYLGKLEYMFAGLHHANVDDSIKNRTMLTGSLMALGYASYTLYSIRDNKKPYSIPEIAQSPSKAVDFITRSGVLGMIGDVTFQDSNGNFDQAVTRLFGPLYSDARSLHQIGKNSLDDLSKSIKQGDIVTDKSRKSVRTLKNYIPYNNQPLVKAWFEYSASDAFLEWVDPATLRRNKSRMKEKGIEKFIE